jgi:hypothetical protein
MKKSTSFIIIAAIIIVLLGVFLIVYGFRATSAEKTSLETNLQNVVEVKDDELFTDDHEHEHSVEIEGSKIKQLTIQQIANLWQIDSNELLTRIIDEFDFQENYTTETILEEMRNEYKFSPAIIKDIAEEIKQENNK